MRRPQRWVPVLVASVCLAVAAIAAVVTSVLHGQSEQRLLDQRADELGVVLATATSGLVERPLAAAAEVAEASNGDGAEFQAALSRSISAGDLAVRGAVRRRVTRADRHARRVRAARRRPPRADRGDASSLRSSAPTFAVIDTLDLPGLRLGYASTSSRAEPRYVVYAESELRAGPPQRGDPFADLDFALYLGEDSERGDLLVATATDVPIEGRRAASTTPFGDRSLTLVVSTDAVLSGRLSASLPWLMLGAGVVLAAVGAAITRRLVLRRRDAESLADSLAELFGELAARTSALQQSLIPAQPTAPPGFEVAAHYATARGDGEVGGDFYDLFPLDGDRWGIAIGDVCGRGIEAAALTGLARHTVRAAARHLDDPAEVLAWTHEAINAQRPDTFCTACFAFLDLEDGRPRLRLSLGGHPQPLLRSAGSVVRLGEMGTLLGMIEPRLVATTHVLQPGDTLVFYTDGLTDAPGARAISDHDVAETVRVTAESSAAEVIDALLGLVSHRRPDGGSDDTALLVVRCLPVGAASVTGPTSSAEYDESMSAASR